MYKFRAIPNIKFDVVKLVLVEMNRNQLHVSLVKGKEVSNFRFVTDVNSFILEQFVGYEPYVWCTTPLGNMWGPEKDQTDMV